jgi:hypothetical protein
MSPRPVVLLIAIRRPTGQWNGVERPALALSAWRFALMPAGSNDGSSRDLNGIACQSRLASNPRVGVLELPGVLAYGDSQGAVVSKVQALALRVLAERLEHGEAGRGSSHHFLQGGVTA